MTTFNGLDVTVHLVDDLGMAIVNKGPQKTIYTFKVRADLIEGLILA